MNKLDVSQATATKAQPLLSTSFDFFQEGIRNTLSMLGKANSGKYNLDNGKYIVLYGLERVGNDIYAGALYSISDGEIYNVDGASGVNLYSNAIVIATNYTNDPSLDPITFADGTTGSVHKVRSLQIVDAVSGTGMVDYADVIYLHTDGDYDNTISHATSSSSVEYPTGSAYTTPAYGKRCYVVSFHGDVAYTTSGATQGATIDIRNAGVAVATARTNHGTSIGNVVVPISIQAIVEDVPTSTVLTCSVQRAGTNNATLTGVWSVRGFVKFY